MEKKPSQNYLQMLVILAMLLALEVILTRFLSITLPIVRIGLGFLPIAVAAILYGPVWAGLLYAMGDFIGAQLFPVGPYFPGFTLTCFLVGVIYGVFLYKKEITWLRCALAAGVSLLLCTLLLNSLWISILYGKAFMGLLPARAVEAAIMLPVQTLLIKIVNDSVLKRLPKGIAPPAKP